MEWTTETSSSEENVAAIDADTAKDPEKSVRRIATELDLTKISVHRDIRNSLSLYPYGVQILQRQTETNKFCRLEFCDTFLRLVNGDETVLSRIQFSDEVNSFSEVI